MLGICRDFNFINLKNEKNHVQNVGVLTPKRTVKSSAIRVINVKNVAINFICLQGKQEIKLIRFFSIIQMANKAVSSYLRSINYQSKPLDQSSDNIR